MTTLPNKDKDEAISRYTERFNNYGYSPKSLGWNKGKQEIRFDVLLSKFHLENKSFLDIGCGFGDLNSFLDQKTNTYQYLGIDLVGDFVDFAAKKWDKEYQKFICDDFLKVNIVEDIDISIASGIFNHKLLGINNYEYFELVLKKSFLLSNQGVAFDFLSDKVDYKEDNLFYFNPEKVLSIAYKYSSNLFLRNDYMPFEFSVVLFKDSNFDSTDTVYKRFKSSEFIL
jgi:SAM-dependent methyltransferase